MDREENSTVCRFDYLFLLLIMGLAFYLAFIPHQHYPYPVHIDEWIHLAQSRAIMAAGDVIHPDPFLGQTAVGVSANLEASYHVLWGVFQSISGLSWLTIFRYFPGFVFMITILSVYVLARREGFGWEAALLTCLIPTTVGILGPAFMVPMALGLVFVPLCMFLAFNFRSVWAYLTIFVFTALLLSAHPPSAVCLVIILAPYILLNLKGNFKHSLALTLTLLVPFLAPFPWIFNLLLPTAQSLFAEHELPAYVSFPRLIATYGHLPVAVALLGIGVLAFRGGKKAYGLILGLLALLLMLAVFYTFHYGVPIMYERGQTYMMLMLGIVAGAGLMWVRKLRLPERLGGRTIPSLIRQNAGRVLCLVLVVFILAIAIPARQNTPYYHMLDQYDYETFVWIESNVGEDYDKAVLDPWKATAFVAITGKKVFSRIQAFPLASDEQANAFLNSGCQDTTFLIENGISLIYTRLECDNPDLIEIRDSVYLLKAIE